MAYGWELVVDLHECDVSTFTERSLQQFCAGLCELIGMEREDFHLWASDPAEYEETPPHLYGISAVQFITTSNLTIHTLPKLRAVYINLFSCKRFDPQSAEKFCGGHFKGDVRQSLFVERL